MHDSSTPDSSTPPNASDPSSPAAPAEQAPSQSQSWLPPLPLERTLTHAIIGMATLFALAKPVGATDLAAYLRMGEWMHAHGRLLEHEPFLLSAPGAVFQNGTWLSQWLFYGLYGMAGYPALQVMLAVIMFATLILVTKHVRSRAPSPLAAAGVLFAFLFLLQNLAIRPQAFSIVLFSAIYLLLDCYAERRWTPVALIGLMGLWSNLHGAFPIAFALPAVYWLEQVSHNRSPLPGDHHTPTLRVYHPRRWFTLALCMLIGSYLNPYGPLLYQYVFENSTMPASRGLDEWLPPRPETFLGGRFYLGLIGVGLLIWQVRRRVKLAELLLFGLFAFLAARSQRMIVWWGLVTAPLLVRWLSFWLESLHRTVTPSIPSRLHSGLGYSMLVFWAVLGLASWPTLKSPQTDDRGDYYNLEIDTPIKVATWLMDMGRGRMFCRFEWGSYFLWRLYPTYQPFIDIRIWIFPDALWSDYIAASRGEDGWEALMDKFQIDTMVLSLQTQEGLIKAATDHAQWHEVYHDDQAVVFRRQGKGEM